MASPPPFSATSPPGPSPLALPRQRPSLQLPGQVKSRKPSLASISSSTHPLRQTSFPPPDSLEAQHQALHEASLRYSPSQASQGSLEDEFSDSEIASAISLPIGEDGVSRSRKRKRGEKKALGRPRKSAGLRTGSVSLVNGEDGTSTKGRRTPGAPSIQAGDGDYDDAPDDDDDDDGEPGAAGGGRLPVYQGGQMTTEELAIENAQRNCFRQYMEVVDKLPFTDPERRGMTTRSMAERYDFWTKSRLKKEDVRKLINQTLSQSVPANVVIVVNAYAKMFAGLIITEARQVQSEWLAVEKQRAGGEENPTFKRLKRLHDAQHQQENVDVDGDERMGGEEDASTPTVIKPEASSSPTQSGTQQSGDKAEDVHPGGAGGLLTSVEECDRGPLQPDHLREALRRYKQARKGGAVGFTGLSLEGRENAAPRMGGRRLFR